LKLLLVDFFGGGQRGGSVAWFDHQPKPALVHAERVAEMTTPPSDGPHVLALGGGQILLRGAAVIDCWRAVSSTIRNAQRRDSLHSPARLITLERGLAKEAQLAAASGRLDVRDGTFLPPFSQNVEVIDATEAGRLLGLSSRQVRRLSAELGGRKVAGRWLFDSMAVAAHAVDRKRAGDSGQDGGDHLGPVTAAAST
jgi:hypothetical protein